MSQNCLIIQMRKPVKVEKTHSSHGTAQMMRPPPESSPSDDSDSSSTTSHVGPPRMTLSERYSSQLLYFTSCHCIITKL